MKRTLCLLLAFLLFLFPSAFAEDGDPGDVDVVQVLPGGQEENSLSPADGDAKGDTESAFSQSYGYLASTGPYAWMVMEGQIRCVDIRSRQTASELPVSSLYTEQESDLMLAGRGSVMTLCAVTGAGSASLRVTLYELALQDGAIALLDTRDATEDLGFLYDGSAQWMETSLIACAGGLLVPALDTDFIYRLYMYEPVSRELREIGTVPQADFTALFAYGDDILLIGPSEEYADTEALTRISATDGKREPLGSIMLDSIFPMNCIALDEAGQTLYYYIENTGYRTAIGSEMTPEPFCTAQAGCARLRYGVAAEGVYAVLDETGGLLYQDTTVSLQAEKLRVLDLMGTDLVSAALPAFSAASPEFLGIVESGDDQEAVLNEILNQSADHDAFIISLGSDMFKALAAKGYLGDMGSSTELTTTAAAFPERIRSRILDGSRLTAFPVMLQNSVMLLDTAAVCEMTGLTREEIPTDWPGFLALLRQIGEDGLLENSGRILYESGIGAETFRGIILTSILQDAMLWLNRDESRLSSLQAVLTPALQALDGIDLQLLGLVEEGETDGKNANWMQDEESPFLMTWTEPEIAVMDIPAGMEYWPLSLTEGGEKVLPQDVAVIILNPRSAHPEGVIRLVECVNRAMDTVTRMELDRSLTEPVKNENYEQDIEYVNALIPMYEEAAAAAATDEEAAEIRAELDEMRAWLANYEQNGAWLISADSIALYRSLEDLFEVHGDEFWNDENVDDIFYQYMDGMLDSAAFVRQLASILQMSRMETE